MNSVRLERAKWRGLNEPVVSSNQLIHNPNASAECFTGVHRNDFRSGICLN